MSRQEVAAKAITTRYGDPVRRWKQDVDDATVALAAADAHDQENGIHRVALDDATVERAAEAAALVDDEDGCFERVRAWEALEDWEQEAYPYERPSDDYEACEYWRKRVRAVIAALGEASDA